MVFSREVEARAHGGYAYATGERGRATGLGVIVFVQTRGRRRAGVFE
ncbi:MAG: hypothetical protein K8953_11865 [Proteobacteria bacterium]|nr:hypothetical protein [Pseudomonadota bacterium]